MRAQISMKQGGNANSRPYTLQKFFIQEEIMELEKKYNHEEVENKQNTICKFKKMCYYIVNSMKKRSRLSFILRELVFGEN